MGEGENDNLTLSQTTHFRQLQTERVCRRQFQFDANGRMFSKLVKNTVGKGEFAHYEQFILSHTVFKRLLMQTRKNLGLFGNGLSSLQAIYLFPTLFSKDL